MDFFSVVGSPGGDGAWRQSQDLGQGRVFHGAAAAAVMPSGIRPVMFLDN